MNGLVDGDDEWEGVVDCKWIIDCPERWPTWLTIQAVSVLPMFLSILRRFYLIDIFSRFRHSRRYLTENDR